jgi:opacity protein-like surface antigen
MTKKLPLIIVWLLLLQIVQAQDNNETAFKRFGFRVATNFSHINFAKGSPPPTVPIVTNWKAGINIGFFVAVHLTKNLDLQPEYLFSQMGGDVKATNTSYHFNYFSMPVLLKYQLHKKIFVLAGPQFDMLVGAKKSVNGVSTDITHDTEERSIGFTAGFEYQLIKSFFVGARYMHGFNHIGLGQRSSIQEFKYELAQITAGVRF